MRPASPSRVRAAITLGIGLASFALSFALLRHSRTLAGDFTWPWRAARALLLGHDPYAVIQATGPYPFSSPFYYPLPAALLVLPLAPLPPELAGALFFGLSSALLAWAVTRDSLARLPLFLSTSFIFAAGLAQWSPLLSAAAILPGLGFLAVAKPNLGLAAFAARPSWHAVAGGGALVAASLLLLPAWPLEWLRAVRQAPQYVAPVATTFGPALLLALLRWRRPEARLLAVLACVPQNLMFFDQLPLWLVARTFRESALLSIASLVAYFALARTGLEIGSPAYVASASRYVMALLYLPALLMVLRRPNTSDDATPPSRPLPGAP